NADGRAFLQEARDKGLSSPRVLMVAQQMVTGKRGAPKNVGQALQRLIRYHQSLLRGANPYLERIRVELPEQYVEWDAARVLPVLASRNGMFVEAVREWGTEFENAQVLIADIGNRTQPAIATKLRAFFG